MQKKLIAIALTASLLATGCSSIVSDSNYSVVVNSAPTDAEFTITNRAGNVVETGTTPTTVTLKASSGYFKTETYTITLNKEGLPEKKYELKSTLDGWYFGNILFGGLIGMLIVDPLTGAMYKLPKTVDINLNPESPEVDDTENTKESKSLTIRTIDTLTEQQKSYLVKL